MGFAACSVAVVLLIPTISWASSLIYKNYLVRYDRGWDILVEPYVVRQGDWVLKIFRQKGEIAHTDFREFLSIFQRLNPHIRDIDMIRPGQAVDIPLRKLEHGTLPGQASGVVTIPFVALTQVDELIVQHSKQYEVQWGDTVSVLLARKYGRFGSPGYKEGVKLFKAANPQITDLNRIYAGQKVYLPDPAMREESWYASIYDEHGNLRKGLSSQGSAAAPPTGADAGLGTRPAAISEPEPAPSPLQEAAAVVGGQLFNKGTYFVPRPGKEDFEVDLSRHPLLELENTGDLVFSQSDEVMGVDKASVQQFWSGAKVVSYDPQSSVAEIVDAIFESLEEENAPSQVAETGFSDQGVQVRVRAKWIRSQSDGRQICIMPISAPTTRTPEAFRRYLEQHGLVLREVLSGGKTLSHEAVETTQRHIVHDILDLAPANQKEFVQNLAKALGYQYTPNVVITFSYAGVMVEASANLFSTGDGRELLVDFGELYGDALKAIRKSGPEVVQITAEDAYDDIVSKLLSGLGVIYKETPTFLGAPRPEEYNTVVAIPGILLAQNEGRETLLTGAALPAAVTDLVSANGVAIVQW